MRDNGAGFEQAYAQKLFGAFQRLHSATEFEGRASAWPRCSASFVAMGVASGLEGEVGRGATFYFTL